MNNGPVLLQWGSGPYGLPLCRSADGWSWCLNYSQFAVIRGIGSVHIDQRCE